MLLSIIIPVCNERVTIGKILASVSSLGCHVPFEVVVVDDGSTDGTKEIIQSLKKRYKMRLISYKQNRGKGYAVRRGIKASKGDVIVIQDADMEYPTYQISKLLRKLEQSEGIVYGSRFLGTKKNMRPIYVLANLFFSFLTNFLFGSKLTDIETCYKMVRTDILRVLNLTSDGFEIEAEITAKLLKAGYTIKEIPIIYRARGRKKGKKITWVDGIKTLLVLLRVRFS